MERKVFCIKYQQELPAMVRAPIPGEDGDYLLQHVSQQAWQEWLVEQTKLINEYTLSPLSSYTRSFLRDQRVNFLHNRPLTPYQPPDHD